MFLLLSSADFFFFAKSSFTKNYIRITIRVFISLDPYQARRFVRPDLCPNCCICYQQTTLVGKEFETVERGLEPATPLSSQV